MRFKEFQILKENREKVVVIGDSIAVGIAGAGGVSKEYTQGGKNTSFILQNFVTPFAKSNKARGSTVILSSGAANSANVNTVDGQKFQSENLAPVSQQIKLLKDAGATVVLVGVASGKTPPQNPTQYTKGKKWIVDYTGMNDKLAAIASANGAEFLGPLEEFDPNISRGDGIHPYNGYRKLFQAGAAKADSATNEPRAETKFYAIGDSHANAIGKSGKFENLASDGRSAFSSDNDAAIRSVPENSTVVLSAGGNDMMRSDKDAVSNRINNLINKLKEKKAKVYFVLIGETDNLRFARDRNKLRQIIKANLPSGIEVIDIGKLSVDNGDGLHAPMSWYAEAAQTVKSGGRSVAPIGNAAASPGAPRDKDKKDGSTQEIKPYPLQAGPPFRQEDVKAVQLMQRKLTSLGYSVGPMGADGKFGPYTQAALAAFQKDYHDIDGNGKEYAENDFKTMQRIADNKIAKVTNPTKPVKVDPSQVSVVGDDGSKTGDAIEALIFFIDKGWKGFQAAGIVGNLQAESGINLNTSAVGDGGQAYGIAQWHPPRQRDFARLFKKDIRQSSFKEQLTFVNWELNNSEAKAGAELRKTENAREAAIAVDQYYERSNGAHRQKRIQYAQALISRTS